LWLVITLAVLVLLILFLLAIPVGLAFYLDVHRQAKARITFLWMFGLVHRQINFDKDQKIPKEKREKQKTKDRGFKLRSFLRARGFVGQIFKLIRSILGCIHIKSAKCYFRLGFDDPVLTGMLFGYVYPLNLLLPRRFSLNIEPVFPEVLIEGSASGIVTLRPICLVVPLLRFIFSLVFLRFAWDQISGKWKSK
jgi:hypothetical protein